MSKVPEHPSDSVALIGRRFAASTQQFLLFGIVSAAVGAVLGIAAYPNGSAFLGTTAVTMGAVGVGFLVCVPFVAAKGRRLTTLLEHDPDAVTRYWVRETTQVAARSGVELNRIREVMVLTRDGRSYRIPAAAVSNWLRGESEDSLTPSVLAALAGIAPRAAVGFTNPVIAAEAHLNEVRQTLSVTFFEALSGVEKPVPVGDDTITVKVPPLVESGAQLHLRNVGVLSDLYLVIHVTPHPVFERRGRDIYGTITVSPKNARDGLIVDVATLEAEVELEIPAGTAAGQHFRMRGAGALDPVSGQRGDHYVLLQTD